MEQGETRFLPSGETETNSYLSGETNLAPPGLGEAEPIPQPSGKTEPAFKALGETEFIPWPSGEIEPVPMASGEMEINLEPSSETEPVPMASGETEINLEPSVEAELSPKGVGRGRTKLLFTRTRDETMPLCVQKFFMFGGYWFHLLGYPGIRSPTDANHQRRCSRRPPLPPARRRLATASAHAPRSCWACCS